MFNGNQDKFVDDKNILNDIELKRIELQKEQQKFYDQRTAYKRVIRKRTREEELNDIISGVVKNGSLPCLNYVPCNIETNDSDMLISLNDLHYGADVDNFWNKYNSEICKTYISKYLDEIISYQSLYHCETAIVWENGDTINGLIHQSIRLENKENITQQVMGVSELISDFIAELPNSNCCFIAPTIYSDSQRQIDFVKYSKNLTIKPFSINDFVDRLESESTLYNI